MISANIITLISIVAAVLTTSCFVPQAIKAITSPNTKSISLIAYIFLAMGIFLWLIYGYLTWQLAILVSNCITFVLVVVILSKKIYNVRKGIDN